MRNRAACLLGPALLVAAGCSGGNADGSAVEATASSAATTTVVSTTVAPSPTTTEPPEASCVVTVLAGDFLSKIASRTDGVSTEQIQAENRLDAAHILHPGDELDVCIDNDVDDITGASRIAPAPATVRRQQYKLNELFASYRFVDLVVDGDSGPLTRQLLCAARMGLGMEISGAHMPAGSAEEEALLAAESIALPDGAAATAGKWILIDKTCQVIFTGEGDELVNIYPTSTGESGYSTTNVNSVSAFRFDPAFETDGWHDSSAFPVAADNPLNGNMYKPIYFNDGEAIHGAGFVPPTPRSKGCARTFPLHQDEIISWLGMSDITEATWQESAIGLSVTVQGEYRPVD